MKKSFFDFFPVPKFLEMPSVGISISDTNLRMIELLKNSSGFKLGKFAEKEIPMGVVNSGYVNNKDRLVSILSELKKEYKLNFIKATLPEDKAYLFKTKIPIVENDEIRSSVEFKIEENVPLSLSESIFDYDVIKGNKGDDFITVNVSVLSSKVVQTYLDIFKSAGLSVLSFDTESRSISRAVIKFGDERTYLILNLDKSKVGFYIVSQGIIQFSSMLNVKIETLLPDYDAKNLSAPQSANTSIYIKSGASESNSLLKEEISKIFTYWHSHNDGSANSKIEKIIICGEPKYADYLNKELPVGFDAVFETANVWVNAFPADKPIPGISFEESLKFGAAIGVAFPNI